MKAGLLLDPLSITMALFITGVGALIHLYSVGYMHGDEDYPRFFVYLNLFAFSMLTLVLADNFLLSFLGWEGVGACSYFLISFWFERDTAASAGKKAFVTNRVGDFGFMVAMFLIFSALGSLAVRRGVRGRRRAQQDHGDRDRAAALPRRGGQVGAAPALRVAARRHGGPDARVCAHPRGHDGHRGRLPDVPHQPHPRAGARRAARSSPRVGAATALFAATIACAQNDIKRVLAYSTISQLGYMFLAVGSGAYVAAVFHMVTHAFFKALLFLGAGSVIHGLHDEQDMKRMGDLRRYLPITSATFIVGWLAIAGIPPFAGLLVEGRHPGQRVRHQQAVLVHRAS